MGIKIVSSKLEEERRVQVEEKANRWLRDGVNKFDIAQYLANEHQCAVSTQFLKDDIVISLI